MVSRCGGHTNYSPPVDSGFPGAHPHGGASQPPPTQPPVDPYDIDQRSSQAQGQGSAPEEKALLDAINKARQEHGLNPLKESATLNQAARENDAINNRSGLGHHVELGKYGADGEITGSASAGMTPDQAVDMWLNSPGHRAILLDPNQTEVCVSMDGKYATADFI